MHVEKVGREGESEGFEESEELEKTEPIREKTVE